LLEKILGSFGVDLLRAQSESPHGVEDFIGALGPLEGCAVLWRRAVELARRMLGRDGPVWQAAGAYST
jgi:hypothetical protein